MLYNNRTYCGEIIDKNTGNQVFLCGWVDSIRDLGGIIFIRLRDISGIVQIVVDPSISGNIYETATQLKSEYSVTIKGTVRLRDPGAVNKDMKTGTVEVTAEEINILHTSPVPPFPIDSREPVGEDVRLRYRFLDLRREEMREAMVKRHKAMHAARNYLSDNRFFEIETPILNKSTPEGARDYLVPSRINKGEFYALPQSPQLFKQILMISGFDRYFQIVKCFRDEDLRNDRQPEFTQIDMEMSFISQDMVMSTIEGLLQNMVKAVDGRDINVPFKRMGYDEAMLHYGSDAPDTRFDLLIEDCSDMFSASEFKVFSQAMAEGGVVRAFSVPDNGSFSRKVMDQYAEQVKTYGAKGLPFVKFSNENFEAGISKFLSDTEKNKLIEKFKLSEPAVIIFSADSHKTAVASLGYLRKKIAEDCGLIDANKLNFLWVTDFPLFEYDDIEKRFYSMHHPFTSPKDDQRSKVRGLKPQDTEIIKAQAYDVVLNGVEIGGGSIRIDDYELQKEIFILLGISEEEAKEKFSFLVEALQYGAPPHGGIALGLDRIMMILLKKQSIRDVIAFPKTARGQCLMSGAPSAVSDIQLQELSLKVVK